MNKPSQFVDVSKFPENEKPHIIHLAMMHNALCEDVDKISGLTPEEKAATWAAFSNVRTVLKWLHGKRFNMALGSFQLCVFLFIMKQFGIQPDQVSRLFEAIIGILEKQG